MRRAKADGKRKGTGRLYEAGERRSATIACVRGSRVAKLFGEMRSTGVCVDSKRDFPSLPRRTDEKKNKMRARTHTVEPVVIRRRRGEERGEIESDKSSEIVRFVGPTARIGVRNRLEAHGTG